MNRICPIVCLLLIATLSAATDYRRLGWEDLVPGGVLPELPSHGGGGGFPEAEANDFDTPQYTLGVVSELNGEVVQIPGFVVPLDVSGDEVKTMLLVPYFGACIHLPPPPANQVVYVEFTEPATIESIWEPVWVRGTLSTESFKSGIGDASYTIKADSVVEYQY